MFLRSGTASELQFCVENMHHKSHSFVKQDHLINIKSISVFKKHFTKIMKGLKKLFETRIEASQILSAVRQTTFLLSLFIVMTNPCWKQW